MLPLVQKSRSDEIKLVLASGSARRRSIFETLVKSIKYYTRKQTFILFFLTLNKGFKFEVTQSNFPENLDKTLFANEIDYVQATCKGKIEALPPAVDANTIQIACDTVVIRSDGAILEKPGDFIEAFEMIKSLLGKKVKVVSVVQMRSLDKITSFSEETTLEMRDLDEINDSIIEGYLNDPSINYK